MTESKEMKSQGMIENEDEYNAAVAKVEAGLTFEKGYSGASNYSYHTDATIKQVIQQVMEEKNISHDLAENYVYGSGLTIYSTQDTTIQARVEEEFVMKTLFLRGASGRTPGRYDGFSPCARGDKRGIIRMKSSTRKGRCT